MIKNTKSSKTISKEIKEVLDEVYHGGFAFVSIDYDDNVDEIIFTVKKIERGF